MFTHPRTAPHPRQRLAIAVQAFLLVAFVAGMAVAENAGPPAARQIDEKLTLHGDTRIDPWYWLNQRDNPEVIAYLEAENEYTTASLAHTEPLQRELFKEIKGRIKQDDSTAPYRWKKHYYYTRYEEGNEYPVYCRKKGSLEAAEQVLFDVNAFAADHSYYWMRQPVISPQEDLAAFAADDFGRRLYTVRIKDLASGMTYAEEIPGVSGNMVWAEDNKTLFYARKHPTTLRVYQVWRHELGTDPSSDMLVHEETDDTFSCSVGKTKSDAYLTIVSEHTLRTEVRTLDATDPTGTFTVFLPREGEHEYSVDHFADHWYIKTNDQAANFRLMRTPVSDTAKSAWTEVIPHREDVRLMGFEVFQDHLVLMERKDGLRQIRIKPWDGSPDHYIDFGEPTYDASLDENPEIATTQLRFAYESMTTPASIFEYDMISQQKTLLKQDEVLGGFSADDYVSERLWATAGDGRKIPVSLVYHESIDPRADNPLLEYGYGSYGSSMDASFSAARLSLLDRGFIYAIAHIRGGEEMGRWWYEEGKLLNKKNTFTDFIDVGRFLVSEGYTSPEKLYCYGGSAGGLLIGAVINIAPELYHGAIAAVPFVDVVTTMLDESIPLTTGEFDEWGDPTDREHYDYMLSYSPYDQVSAQAYPHLLVTTGLHDSQVQYWEPAKWVARLRTLKTDDNLLLLKTNMDAGHGGASGRYKRYEETAFKWAFLLDLAKSQAEQSPDSGEAMRR